MASTREVVKGLDAAAVKVLHDVFFERYKQELASEEDLFRTLPFFATALGVGVAGASFALSRLPVVLISLASSRPLHSKALASVCVFLIAAAALLVFWCILTLMFAVGATREQVAISETDLLKWVVADAARAGVQPSAAEIQARLIASYRQANRSKRRANAFRKEARSRAVSRLLLAYLCSFAATVIIFVCERFAVFT